MSHVIRIAVLCAALCGLSACQLFMDGRNEPLMVVSAQEWAEVSHKAALHEAAEQQRMVPQPLNGAEMISFTTQTDAYLAGCSSLGIVEVHHHGSEAEAMTLLRNEAVKLNATAIVPLDFYQDKTTPTNAGQTLNFMKGRMVRCPDMNAENGA